ncbi:MAG TPA: LysR substrate-binding domain-containing protein [Solirubrobacteraceae bacterium]|jgi:DNA-binding transcriptional LysR family regulator
MDERRLRYFLAVVEDGGVTRAARRLHVAQPSLSQSLRALERELGAELFDRVGRGLRLTAAGEALVGPARQALRTMDAARAAVDEVAELVAGTLQIAALATLAVDPLSALIGSFRREHPGVAICVREPESAAAVSTLVRAGECELGLAHLPLPQENLRTLALGEQELLFVLPPGSETGRALAPAALAEVPLVVSPPGTSTRMLLEQALQAVEVTPRIAVETDSREAIVPLVLAGAGAALLPATLAEEAARRGAVVRAARPRIVRRIGLVQRDGPLSPAARAFSALAAAV